jgi:hypothetical protein
VHRPRRSVSTPICARFIIIIIAVVVAVIGFAGIEARVSHGLVWSVSGLFIHLPGKCMVT